METYLPRDAGLPAAVAALGISVFYVLSLVIHRLLFSPVARFPGPKLAALINARKYATRSSWALGPKSVCSPDVGARWLSVPRNPSLINDKWLSSATGLSLIRPHHVPLPHSYPIYETIRSTPSILPSRPEGHSNSDRGSTDKRRPVRRDLEKRRQQNIQAQKKYREKLKKRLDHLETLAASVADSTSSTSTECQSSCQSMGQSLNHHSDESSVGLSDLTLPTSIPPASSSEVALWDPTTSIDPSHLIHNTDTASTSQYWAGYVDCGCLSPHVHVSSSGPRQYRDLRVLNVGPSLFSADPYVNTLRVERICIIQAILSNCLHIGITEDMFCDDDAISPFYRPSGDTVDDSGSDSVVRTIQSIFKTLKQDVRPIREQITTIHRPMIDALPFPTLRKNLINSGNAVDEELYHDLLNGLVCWGGAGVGRRDRDCFTGHISTGTPWDSRSWEARTWFLQKYWALLGGEEGELVRQSEWWRNMRGDETDPWLWL